MQFPGTEALLESGRVCSPLGFFFGEPFLGLKKSDHALVRKKGDSESRGAPDSLQRLPSGVPLPSFQILDDFSIDPGTPCELVLR